jgi:hypothetical protein
VKIGNPANYFVRVSSRAWEGDEREAAPYAGTYTVDLNSVVTVAFVDDVAGFGPPWTADALPPAGTRLHDPALARLATLLGSAYVVTPNDALAGRTETFVRPWGASDRRQGLVLTSRAACSPGPAATSCSTIRRCGSSRSRSSLRAGSRRPTMRQSAEPEGGLRAHADDLLPPAGGLRT